MDVIKNKYGGRTLEEKQDLVEFYNKMNEVLGYAKKVGLKENGDFYLIRERPRRNRSEPPRSPPSPGDGEIADVGNRRRRRTSRELTSSPLAPDAANRTSRELISSPLAPDAANRTSRELISSPLAPDAANRTSRELTSSPRAPDAANRRRRRTTSDQSSPIAGDVTNRRRRRRSAGNEQAPTAVGGGNDGRSHGGGGSSDDVDDHYDDLNDVGISVEPHTVGDTTIPVEPLLQEGPTQPAQGLIEGSNLVGISVEPHTVADTTIPVEPLLQQGPTQPAQDPIFGPHHVGLDQAFTAAASSSGQGNKTPTSETVLKSILPGLAPFLGFLMSFTEVPTPETSFSTEDITVKINAFLKKNFEGGIEFVYSPQAFQEFFNIWQDMLKTLAGTNVTAHSIDGRYFLSVDQLGPNSNEWMEWVAAKEA